MIRNPLAGALADSLEWAFEIVYLAFNTGFKINQERQMRSCSFKS